MNFAKFSLTLLCLLLPILLFSQAKFIHYQAIISDENQVEMPGFPLKSSLFVNGPVCIKFAILSSSGVVEYEEKQLLTTDAFGLVTATIGLGNQLSQNSFEQLIWDQSLKQLGVKVSIDGCLNFQEMVTQTLGYVPYSFYAKSVDYLNVKGAPINLSHFKNDVGYLVASDLLPLRQFVASSIASSIAAIPPVVIPPVVFPDPVDISGLELRGNKSLNVLADSLSDVKFPSVKAVKTYVASTIASSIASSIAAIPPVIIPPVVFPDPVDISGLELRGNKSLNILADSLSDVKFPSVKAVKTYVASSIASSIAAIPPVIIPPVVFPDPVDISGLELRGNKSLNVLADSLSDVKFPSVKAVKTYVASTIASSIAAIPPVIFPDPVDISGLEPRGNKSLNVLADSLSDVKFPSVKAVKTYVVNSFLRDVRVNGLSVGLVTYPKIHGTAGQVLTTSGSGNLTWETVAASVPVVPTVVASNFKIGTMLIGNGLTEKASNQEFGFQALQAVTTGEFNLAIGYNALMSNTSGAANTALGFANMSYNTIGSNNTAIGHQALQNNVIGISNVAVGSYALYANIGNRNLGIGHKALFSNTSGRENVSVGFESNLANSVGIANVAVGNGALANNRAGSRAVAIGHGVMFYANAGEVAYDNLNTAVGFESMKGLGVYTNTFNLNSAVGAYTLKSLSTGSGNAVLGYNAGAAITTGSNNTALGNQTIIAATINNASAIGYGASVSTDNTIKLGNALVTSVETVAAISASSFVTTSDSRLKRNIVPLKEAGVVLNVLNPVSYQKRKNLVDSAYTEVEYGFIAQELQKVLPDLVKPRADGILQVNYTAMIPLLTKALQEQHAEIVELRELVHQLMDSKKK
jgi:hypothetical protein